MVMDCKWSYLGKGWREGYVLTRPGECFKFELKQLPDREWEWTVWHPDRPGSNTCHGIAATGKAGLAAVEAAAARMSGLPIVNVADILPRRRVGQHRTRATQHDHLLERNIPTALRSFYSTKIRAVGEG
jgi:hypothetical protein